MASEVDIANLALTILEQEPIANLSDNTMSARTINANYELIRDAELASRNWRFAIARDELAALVSVPNGEDFTTEFQLPTDFLKPIRIGNFWPGHSDSDYRTGPTSEYSIEGSKLLTNYAAPLLFVYVAKVTNTALYHPCFVSSLAAKIAETCCKKITGSNSSEAAAVDRYRREIAMASRANALFNPPAFIADNSWITARL